MKTDSIEQLIQETCRGPSCDEELAELVEAIAESQGREATEETVSEGIRFIREYIFQVPYMIKVAWTSACNVGLQDQMRVILDAVTSYWEQDNDVIPDHMGAIGLLDDAYCSMLSLQTVSDHFQLQSGKFLFPTDLTSANRLMRRLIGEPYVSELERFVQGSVNDARILDAVKAMASHEKQLNFESQGTIWNHGKVESMDTHVAQMLGIDT